MYVCHWQSISVIISNKRRFYQYSFKSIVFNWTINSLKLYYLIHHMSFIENYYIILLSEKSNFANI